MGKARKTGNELFDIFWQAYPARNGRKNTKGESLEWFKKNKPAEETVFDMVQWLRLDKESRLALDKQSKFCAPPKDAIRFLKKQVWHDEIGIEVTDSSRYEKSRSKSIYSNNVQSKIDQFSNIIHDWPVGRLKANKSFMSACQLPEVAKWALEQRLDLKGAKADVPVPKPEPVAEPPPVKVEVLRDVPPSKQDRRIKLYYDVLKLKSEKMPLL